MIRSHKDISIHTINEDLVNDNVISCILYYYI